MLFQREDGWWSFISKTRCFFVKSWFRRPCILLVLGEHLSLRDCKQQSLQYSPTKISTLQWLYYWRKYTASCKLPKHMQCYIGIYCSNLTNTDHCYFGTTRTGLVNSPHLLRISGGLDTSSKIQSHSSLSTSLRPQLMSSQCRTCGTTAPVSIPLFALQS